MRLFEVPKVNVGLSLGCSGASGGLGGVNFHHRVVYVWACFFCLPKCGGCLACARREFLACTRLFFSLVHQMKGGWYVLQDKIGDFFGKPKKPHYKREICVCKPQNPKCENFFSKP